MPTFKTHDPYDTSLDKLVIESSSIVLDFPSGEKIELTWRQDGTLTLSKTGWLNDSLTIKPRAANSVEIS